MSEKSQFALNAKVCPDRSIDSALYVAPSPEHEVVAEMAKFLQNIYQSLDMALVSELKQFCDRMEADIFEVITAPKASPFQALCPEPDLD